MKLPSVLLLICGIVAGCNASQPSADQMQAALDRFIKKDNPSATAPIVKFTPSERYIAADFQFADLSIINNQGVKQRIPSGTGLADFWLRDGKWVFTEVIIESNGLREKFTVNEEMN